MELVEADVRVTRTTEALSPWPVFWSPVWVGALAAVATALVIGLIGLAVGAHQVGVHRIEKWSDLRFVTLVFSVCGAFFSFVVGGWVTARIAGIRRPETAMLHGAIVWTLVIPFFLVLGALGATSYFGGWYTGFTVTPPWSAAPGTVTDPGAAAAARNTALGTVTALLIGLVGSVIGGWMASGQPMTLVLSRSGERDVTPRRDLAA